MGLDDVYRFTSITEATGYRPGTMAMKGSWINDKSFKLDYMEAGYTGNFWFVFEDTGVKVHFVSPWAVETITGTVQEE